MNFSIITDNIYYLLFGSWPTGILGGLALTLCISIISSIIATFLGILLGILLAIVHSSIRWLLLIPICFLRAIPVIMLIFWSFFLMPLVFGIDVPAVSTLISALSLIYAAYIAYAMYAGIIAISQNQWQAGLSLGLSHWQVMRLIIAPQALRMMLPSFVNQWVALIKDSSLAYIVNVPEFTYLATQLNGNNYGIYSVELFLFIGLIYYILCSILNIFIHLANKFWLPQTNRNNSLKI